MNLEQAQFEIEALQRRLAEYAGELERVKAQCAAMRSALEGLKHTDGCYCEAAFAMPGTIVKHYDECLAAQTALATDAGKGFVPAEKARVIAEALQSSQSELLFSPRPIIKDEQQRQFIVNKSQVAIAMARELGLLKDE